MTHPLIGISLEEIRSIINELESCDRELLTIAGLKHRVQLLMNGYSCMTRVISSSNAWRARRITGMKYIENIREVWYPKPEHVKTYGRLNRPKKPMFYIAASHETAVLEMRPTVGDRFAVLQLRLKDSSSLPHVMELGVAERKSMNGSRSSVHLLENTIIGRKLLEDHIEKNLLIRSFLAREFMRVVDRGEEHLFKLSVAIGETFLSSPQIHGVLYPSMAGDPSAATTAENMALKPNAADELYAPEICWIAEVESITTAPATGFQIRCVKRAEAIEPDGHIVWG
ncbi:RES domain-containing protein [Pseudomonas benzenivorans]|nr:RES domain-containing protein [Pseudomonas benzenivorans]